MAASLFSLFLCGSVVLIHSHIDPPPWCRDEESMTALHDPTQLPADLPIPTDDGACLHLRGMALPDLLLPSTSGEERMLSQLHGPNYAKGVVLFFYPRTGVPGQPPNLGPRGEEWDSIPGARGCTPQSCGFRDLHAEFAELRVNVFGVSTNTTEHQREFRERMHVPFHFLSDDHLKLVDALNLPTFEFPCESGGPGTMMKRMALYAEPDPQGVLRIRRVWYPVFPPNENAMKVLAWLRQRASVTIRPKNPGDQDFILDELHRVWHSTRIWSLRRRHNAEHLPAWIAEVGDEPVGLMTYDLNHGCDQLEVITLSVRRENLGIGARLLEVAEDLARTQGCARAFLTTTNDNLRALGFYQRQGWKMVAVHRYNADLARRLKPVMPKVADNGLPIRDEVEMEWELR